MVDVAGATGPSGLAMLTEGETRSTFAALQRLAGTLSAECADVGKTLAALDDALAVISGGTGAGHELAGFGLVSLPIMGAVKAVKGVAGQYVKQQTGVPLSTWTDFVGSARDQFTAYVAELDAVGALARGRAMPTPGERPGDAPLVGDAAARADLKTLSDLRWSTQTWKLALGRITQLGQVVDAILRPDPGADLGETDGPAAASSFSGTLQRRLKDVQAKTLDRSGDLREWVLRPFVEVHDKARQLPSQISRISHDVALLEVLIELQTAELRSVLGEISGAEARVVGTRVAACVVLPELSHDLTASRASVTGFEDRLRRLQDARAGGAVPDAAYTFLHAEYAGGLEKARAALGGLEGQAATWRREGPAVLRAGVAWTEVELEILDARRVAEQTEDRTGRRALLERERQRLDEAATLLATL